MVSPSQRFTTAPCEDFHTGTLRKLDAAGTRGAARSVQAAIEGHRDSPGTRKTSDLRSSLVANGVRSDWVKRSTVQRF